MQVCRHTKYQYPVELTEIFIANVTEGRILSQLFRLKFSNDVSLAAMVA